MASTNAIDKLTDLQHQAERYSELHYLHVRSSFSSRCWYWLKHCFTDGEFPQLNNDKHLYFSIKFSDLASRIKKYLLLNPDLKTEEYLKLVQDEYNNLYGGAPSLFFVMEQMNRN